MFVQQQDCIEVHGQGVQCTLCMHLLQHDHSSFDVSLVAFGRRMRIGLKGWFQGFCPLGQLGTKTHLNTSYHSGFFLAKKPPFAQPMNYLNFGTIAKGNRFNEIEEREVPWLPLFIVCLFVLVFEQASRVWVTWLHMQFLFPGCPLNVALFLHSFHVFFRLGGIFCVGVSLNNLFVSLEAPMVIVC